MSGLEITGPDNTGVAADDPNDRYSGAAAARQNKAVQDSLDEANREIDRQNANRGGIHFPGTNGDQDHATLNTTYVNPGSADVGGGPGMAAWYKDDARSYMGDNDAQQSINNQSLNGSLANMSGHRGPQSVESDTLNDKANGSREQQLRALGQMRDAAQGAAPSAAGFQTRQGMNDIMGNRAGAVGGARGLAGLTGAQMGSADQAGGMASNVATAGGMGRSKEIGDAIGMYGSNAGAMRDQDIARLGSSDQNSKFNAQNDTSWKLGNASLAAQQAGLGVAQQGTDNAWMEASMEPGAKQFSNDQRMAAESNNADADKAGAAIAAARESRDHTRALVGGVASAGLGAVGSFAGPVGTVAGAGAGQAIGEATKHWWD